MRLLRSVIACLALLAMVSLPTGQLQAAPVVETWTDGIALYELLDIPPSLRPETGIEVPGVVIVVILNAMGIDPEAVLSDSAYVLYWLDLPPPKRLGWWGAGDGSAG